MVIISWRSLLIFLFTVGLVGFGQIPWWVLALIGLYQVPGFIRFWLPGAKKKALAEMSARFQAVQEDKLMDQAVNQLKNLQPKDIN